MTSRSPWTILALGLVAAMLLSIGMCAGMTTFQETPGGQGSRVALALRSRFGFEAAAVRLESEGGVKVLRVSYRTARGTMDPLLDQQEMRRVADFAARAWQGRDRLQIEDIQVTRTETRGSGCWQRTYVARQVFPNPLLEEDQEPR